MLVYIYICKICNYYMVIYLIFKDTRENDIEKDESVHDKDISKSKGKVTHVLISCMHDKMFIIVVIMIHISI